MRNGYALCTTKGLDGIARLLADGDLRVRLGAGAQVRVRAFTASAVAERLESVYARVTARTL